MELRREYPPEFEINSEITYLSSLFSPIFFSRQFFVFFRVYLLFFWKIHNSLFKNENSDENWKICIYIIFLLKLVDFTSSCSSADYTLEKMNRHFHIFLWGYNVTKMGQFIDIIVEITDQNNYSDKSHEYSNFYYNLWINYLLSLLLIKNIKNQGTVYFFRKL